MSIESITAADRAEFLNLVDAEIRPDRAKTNAWDDFPVILSASNSQWQLIYRTEDGTIAGCMACLIRDLQTSCGKIPVAGIGSVVTRPEFRGKGISTALQNEMLNRLRGKNIPLGVLWTDQPEIYAGRGFIAAGWEIHASVSELTIRNDLDSNFSIRPFSSEDTNRVQKLFDEHTLRTLRNPGDAEAYYCMPGTTGYVLCNRDKYIVAAVFCGKGGDFPNYITEFCGSAQLLPFLFKHVHHLDLANQVLIPPGNENLVNSLVDLGAGWMATPSGQWVILDPQVLGEIVRQSGETVPAETMNPKAWLGDVDSSGMPQTGPITAAIWGFDSV